MHKKLGIFEGKLVEVAELKITGGSDDRVGTLDYGEQIFFVGKATVSKITHEDKKTGFSRIHTATASAMVLLEKEDGERMLGEGQMLADERFGIANLFAQAGATLGYDPDTGELEGDGEEE